MPGGGLYKRVAQATATAREGPGILLQSPGDKADAKSPVIATEDNQANEEEVQQEVCEVKAFTVWYWTEGPEPTFIPETLYMNSKESGHKTGEPRLIVSLSSFEALSNAYVMAVEKEGIKAALLQEKEDLLQEVRVGYYKELSHLRELLGMAKEQMALARQRNLEEHERKRMEEFERQVRETDVHYFNIVDYLEPELKGIMKDAVKQFNRHLMLENFQLKDMLAVYEGSSGDAGLPERLISLLMSKGTTPAQIVKILGGMVSDSKELSDNFYDACRDVLGISKTPLVAEEPAKPKRKPKQEEEHDDPKKSGRQNLSPRPDEHSPTSEGRKPSNQRALQKEAEQAKAEAERLREELEKLKAKMEAEAKKHAQEKAEMQKKMDAAKKQAEEAEKALKAAETKLTKALDDFEKCKKELATAKQKLSEYDHTPGGTKKQAEVDSPTTAARKAQDSGPSQKDLEEARKKAEAAERRLAELEARLKEANAKIGQLTESLADMEEQVAEAKRREAAERERKNKLKASGGDVGGTASNDEGSGNESPSPSELTPGGSKKNRRRSDEPRGSFLKSPRGEESEGRSSKKFQGKKMSFIDRDYSGIERSGQYSALLGKPMSIVEEELARERKMRINLEIEARKLQEELTELGRVKNKLDAACDKYEHDLKDTRAKLRALVEEDESDGVNDVQIFCRWLIRRFGNLENGFRAMDANKSGGMSVYEFNAGLMQMGWIKIVGRRLFKIIDTQEKGEIELEDLEAVFGKFVSGRDDDEEINENLRKAEEEAKAMEKDQLGEAMARVRKLTVANNDLETENKRLKALSSKMEMRAVGSKDGGQGMKNMERKVDLMKEGYDKLKGERDENASKLTAAMWKCREAHILQVKYMRQAEMAEQELKKLQRKYDSVKAMWKKRASANSGISGLSGLDDGFPSGVGDTSVAAMSTALMSNPQLMTGFINSFSLEEDTDDGMTTLRPGTPDSPTINLRPISPSTDRPDSTGTTSISLSPASTAIGFRQGTANRGRRTGSAPLVSPSQTSNGFRRTSTGCSSPTSIATTGPLMCPKCGCALRVKAPQDSLDGTASSNPGALRQLLAAAANIGGGLGSGDELGTEGEDSGNERSMSPEELIANMTDEDLLFGSPQQRHSSIGTLGLGRAHKGGASYRDKIEAQANQPGKKRRWQLLFADAQEKQNEAENVSMNSLTASIRGMAMQSSIRPSSPGSPMASANIMLSTESMNLLEHAKQAREKSLWKEASANEGGFGMQPGAERGDSRGSGLNGLIGQSSARAYGIGGAPVSQSFGGNTGGRVALGSSRRSMPDNVPEPKAFSMANIGSISSQSLATSTSVPMLRGSLQRQVATPPRNQEALSSPARESDEARGLPPAVANLLQPTGLQPAEQRSQLLGSQRSQKKGQRDTSPPERFPQGPPLQIVGNEKLEGQGYPNVVVSPAGDPPSAKDAPDRRPSIEALTPTRPRMSPSLGEGGLLATQMPFDNDDEGHPWHQVSHGNKNIVGMWTGSYKHRRGDSEPMPPQALGADLPDKGPRSPMVVKTGLRRVPAQLPQIGSDPKKMKQDRLVSSMPDLNFHHERPVVVKTPPLAASMTPSYDPVSSPPQSRMRKKSPPRGNEGRRHNVGEQNNNPATLEAPWLYIGRPPPPSQGGPHEASMREMNGTGASHTIPAALRKQFAMAANALELGSHVQRHAAVEQDLGEDFKSPLIVSHCITPMPFEGDAPRSNATSGRVLLS